jgi:hypothetical protein
MGPAPAGALFRATMYLPNVARLMPISDLTSAEGTPPTSRIPLDDVLDASESGCSASGGSGSSRLPIFAITPSTPTSSTSAAAQGSKCRPISVRSKVSALHAAHSACSGSISESIMRRHRFPHAQVTSYS